MNDTNEGEVIISDYPIDPEIIIDNNEGENEGDNEIDNMRDYITIQNDNIKVKNKKHHSHIPSDVWILWMKIGEDFDAVPFEIDCSLTIHQMKQLLLVNEDFELFNYKLHKMRMFKGDFPLNPRATIYEQLSDQDEVLVKISTTSNLDNFEDEDLRLIILKLNKEMEEIKTHLNIHFEEDERIPKRRTQKEEDIPQDSLSRRNLNSLVARLDVLDEKISYKNGKLDLAMKDLKMLVESLRSLPPGQGGTTKISSMKAKENLIGHDGPVWALVCSNDTLYSGSSDETIKVWDLTTFKPRLTLKGHTSIVHALAQTGDESTIISGSDDKNIKIWSVEEQRCRKTIKDDNISCVLRISGSHLFAGSFKCVKVWNLDNYKCVKVLPGHNHWVRAINISNGYCFGGGHNIIKMWDMGNFKCVRTLEQACGSIYSLVVSGNSLIAGTYENTINIWDLRSHECVRTLSGHTGAVYTVAVHGTKVYSGSYDNTIMCWDLKTFSCEQSYIGHSSSVEALCTSDTYGLISGSTDSTIKIWRL